LYVIAPGFSQDEEKFKLLIELSRITFPFLLFISLASFFSAILNSHEKFFIPASAPIILNLILIISLILFHSSATEVAYTSAISLTFAGIIQSIFLLYFARKYFTPIIKFTFKFTFQIKLFFLRLFPSVFASGVNQINILVGTIIASFESGAVSYLYYADRIYQLPLALSGIAIATIILPRLSNSIVKSKKNEIYFIQNRSLELCLFLTLPATVGILIASEEIISALYGYGSFTSDNINVTAKALVLFGTGLPAFALIKIYSSFYFARGNTKTPFYFSTFSVLINVFVSLYYFDDYGFLIIPFSTSLASWLAVVLYQSNLSLNNYYKFDNLFFSKILKSLICSGLMGLLLYFMIGYFSDVLSSASYLKPLTLVTVVFLSASIYFFTAYFIKAFRIKDLKL
jgi:putative peptidoglycan lipid II flippase